MRQRNHPKLPATLAVLAASALLLAACGDDEPDAASDDIQTADDGSTDEPDGGDDAPVPPDGPPIVVRGQDFSEAITLAEVYGQYLSGLGYEVEQLTPAGFRDEALQGIETGELTLIIDYIGGTLSALAPEAGPTDDPDEIVEIISPELEAIGGVLLDYASAQNGDAFVVREDFDGETISDVDGSDVVFGASAQCFERPQCYLGLTDPDVYGIEFADTVTIEYGTLLGEALRAGEVDAVIWEDTAPQIEEFGFKSLEDDEGLFPAQNIAPIVARSAVEAYGQDLVDALDELTAVITTEDLLTWNVETDLEFRESDDVAAEWLEANDLP